MKTMKLKTHCLMARAMLSNRCLVGLAVVAILSVTAVFYAPQVWLKCVGFYTQLLVMGVAIAPRIPVWADNPMNRSVPGTPMMIGSAYRICPMFFRFTMLYLVAFLVVSSVVPPHMAAVARVMMNLGVILAGVHASQMFPCWVFEAPKEPAPAYPIQGA